MCDRRPVWDHSTWRASMQQYLQHHASMTQWVQQLHQNMPHQPWQNVSCQGHHASMSQWVQQLHQNMPHQPWQNFTNQGHYAHYTPQPRFNMEPDYNRSKHHSSHKNYQENTKAQIDEEYVADIEHRDEEDEDEDDSDVELVFNVDAIIAMRNAKDVSDDPSASENSDVSDKEDEGSFEFVDGIEDEKFEFVELDAFGKLQTMVGMGGNPDTKGDEACQKETWEFLYGDKAERIAGLETSMAISFDHFYDLHQPPVFPTRLD